MKLWRRRLPRASTPSPAWDLPKPWEALRFVVDVANSPSFEDAGGIRVLRRRQLVTSLPQKRPQAWDITLPCRSSAGRPSSGYMRAKVAQEAMIKAALPLHNCPCNAVLRIHREHRRCSTDGDMVRLPPALMQPIAADDVAAALADVAVNPPVNGTVELAGPEPLRLDELVHDASAQNKMRDW